MLGEIRMNERELFVKMMKDCINELNETIDSLYITSHSCTKNMLLNRLRKNISTLTMLIQAVQNNAVQNNAVTSTAANTFTPPHNSNRVFTRAELSGYNGKDGSPAYVAINGTVYDVTNNAGWAAATHFGLTAGRDLTNEFSSCHAGQPILNRLRVVGTMAE
jgi:membrane-associated progesterone receptor component